MGDSPNLFRLAGPCKSEQSPLPGGGGLLSFTPAPSAEALLCPWECLLLRSSLQTHFRHMPVEEQKPLANTWKRSCKKTVVFTLLRLLSRTDGMWLPLALMVPLQLVPPSQP